MFSVNIPAEKLNDVKGFLDFNEYSYVVERDYSIDESWGIYYDVEVSADISLLDTLVRVCGL